MSKTKKRHVVVVDLEFTAWEGSMESRWSRPREHTELVQIGAVKLNAETLKTVGEFQMLVRPRVNPVLSDYLVKLIGITNDRLSKHGVDFITAYRAFLDFCGDAPLWAFGRDDLIFAENLKLYAWDALSVPPYTDIIPWFAQNGVHLKGKHACHVAQAAGATFEGRQHDALEDARSVALGLVTMIEKGAPNPFLEIVP